VKFNNQHKVIFKKMWITSSCFNLLAECVELVYNMLIKIYLAWVIFTKYVALLLLGSSCLTRWSRYFKRSPFKVFKLAVTWIKTFS
jgi:hypothetical protein